MGPDSPGSRGRHPASSPAHGLAETTASIDGGETRVRGEAGGEVEGEVGAEVEGEGLDETRTSAGGEAPAEAPLDETRVSDGALAAAVSAALDATGPADPNATQVSDARLGDATAAAELTTTVVTDAATRVPAAGGCVRIDRFVVLRVLGSGGMGTVYAAYDEELGRRVALKVLHGSEAYPVESRAALLAEARAMARLSHPNVVQVHELGEHDGRIFLVMEFVEGVTLGAWLSAEARPWSATLELFIAAGRGLEAAHRAGIVHRDFKPDNVLVGDDGVARVADFGLARPTDAGVRQVAGTPAYMSPEQFLGEPVDARSDVFAFCVALYEALYAEAPYAGDTYEELRANVTAQALRPAPARSVGPAPLRAAIVRGLARDPEARYPSMTALLDALVALTPRPSRWPARIAWLAVVGGVALGVAWLVGQRPGPTPAEVAALAGDAALAGRSASAAEWVYPAEEGSAAATSIRRIVDLERVEGPAGALARGAAARLRERFAADLARLGAHYWETPQTRPFGRDFYAQALIFRPDHEEALKRGNFTIGQLAQLRAQAEASGFTPEELAAVAPLRILANTDDPELAAKLAALLNSCDGPLTQTGGGIAAAARGGAASSAAADPRLATQAEEPAAEAEPEVEPPAEPEPAPEAGPAPEAEPAPEPEAPAKARPRGPSPASIIAQAESARRRGQDGEAMALFGQALALAPGNSTALAALSDIAFDRGDFKEAVRLARQAIKASPKIAEHHTRLGDALFKLGRRSDARAAFVRALELGDGRAQRRIDLLDQEQEAAR